MVCICRPGLLSDECMPVLFPTWVCFVDPRQWSRHDEVSAKGWGGSTQTCRALRQLSMDVDGEDDVGTDLWWESLPA